MRILLFGRNGQVGWELARSLGPLGDLVSHDADTLDLADAQATRVVIREVAPKVIVNAAAYTAVDRAETEVEKASALNAEAPRVIAEEACRLNCLLVHYSTDYVFDGTKAGAYLESDLPNPLNAYGRTKLAGERAVIASGCHHLIFRTSWIYGARGQNFLLTMLRLGRERTELGVVDDQIGAPTCSGWVAAVTAQALARVIDRSGPKRDDAQQESGLYHLS
ncbi:MAG: dTDP-4-dehydrorhamnose reductase, partial [Burkholderiales bacterium]